MLGIHDVVAGAGSRTFEGARNADADIRVVSGLFAHGTHGSIPRRLARLGFRLGKGPGIAPMVLGRLTQQHLPPPADNHATIAFGHRLLLRKRRVRLQVVQNIPNLVVQAGALVPLLLGHL